MASLRAIVATLGVLSIAAAACSSSREDEGAAQAGAAKARPVEAVPTFTGTIESILQDRCQRCHSAGGIAPFPLLTY